MIVDCSWCGDTSGGVDTGGCTTKQNCLDSPDRNIFDTCDKELPSPESSKDIRKRDALVGVCDCSALDDTDAVEPSPSSSPAGAVAGALAGLAAIGGCIAVVFFVRDRQKKKDNDVMMGGVGNSYGFASARQDDTDLFPEPVVTEEFSSSPNEGIYGDIDVAAAAGNDSQYDRAPSAPSSRVNSGIYGAAPSSAMTNEYGAGPPELATEEPIYDKPDSKL